MEAIQTEKKNVKGKDLLRYFILIYWVFFWLLNAIDKLIGGAHFSFVGKDRFAQVERFFDSIGLSHPLITNTTLIFTSALEIFAFVFFAGALLHFAKKNRLKARAWFFGGIVLSLLVFTFFSIGDQIFGDHAELLEHSLFWFITLLSWIIYIRIDAINLFADFALSKKQFRAALLVGTLITALAFYSIFSHNQSAFIERTSPVDAQQISSHTYKISFPFLAGSTAFEKSIAKFKKEHPLVSIDHVYTAPKAMRLGQSDGLIIYIQTKKH